VTIEDLDGPAYDISSQEDRQRLLAEALAHADMQDTQYRQPLPETVRTGQWKSMLALILLALAGYLAQFPPTWLAGPGLPRVADTDRVAGAVAALTLQAEQIRVYQHRNGSLPSSLEVMPNYVSGLRYVRSNNRVFQLIAPRPGGGVLIYDAARPDDRFKSAAVELLEKPGS